MEFSNEFAEPYLRSQAGGWAERKPQKTHPGPLNSSVPAADTFPRNYLLPPPPLPNKIPY